MFVLRNVTNEEIIVHNHLFRETGEDNDSLEISFTDAASWGHDSEVITELASGNLVLSYQEEDVSDVNRAISYLRGVGQVDTDGVPLARHKVTSSKWHYQMYGIDFTTATLNSLSNEDWDGSDLGHATLKFYNSNDEELTTQININLGCVKTVLEWEPPWDYEIIGGQFRQLSIPGSTIRLSVVAVPDVPSAYGGSVPFVNNINLRFIGNEDSIKPDGRTSKKFVYDSENHTNKLKIIVEHGILIKHDMQLVFELFRA